MAKYLCLLIGLTLVINLSTFSGRIKGSALKTNELGHKQTLGNGKNASQQNPISIVMSNLDLKVPEHPMDDPNIKYLENQTETKLNITFLDHGSYQDQMNIKIASGEIPAVVQSWAVDTQLLENNMLLPLNDLINQYGPNLKKYIPKESWDAVTVNGKIYGIPQTAYGNASAARVIYVRRDWMEKVGITKIPKTPEEFKNLLRAFRDKDPNNNGIKDEIPFSGRANLTWMDNLFSMFGANEHSSLIIDNELIPGYVTPNMKKGINYIRELYQEGLIDQDSLVNERNAWEFKILTNRVGAWIHGTEFAWDWQKKLDKALPNDQPDVIAILTPRDPEWKGEVGMVRTPAIRVFNITRNAENPADVIRVFDWLASKKGQEFVMLGIPGKTYSKENGEYQYNKSLDLVQGTAQWREKIFGIVSYSPELMKVQFDNPKAIGKFETSFAIGREEGIPNPLMTIPTFETFRKYPDHRKDGNLWRDAATKIILGAKPISYYDEFIKDWKATGGNEMIAELTNWYESSRMTNP